MYRESSEIRGLREGIQREEVLSYAQLILPLVDSSSWVGGFGSHYGSMAIFVECRWWDLSLRLGIPRQLRPAVLAEQCIRRIYSLTVRASPHSYLQSLLLSRCQGPMCKPRTGSSQESPDRHSQSQKEDGIPSNIDGQF